MERRFTLDGSDALEMELATLCARIGAEAEAMLPPGRLQALLLGGGYGRGEGGVLTTLAGDRPYNDLEFYACLRGHRWVNERRYAQAFHQLAHRFTQAAGIDVEFKLTTADALRRAPITMFSYDLAMGHRVISGDSRLLAPCVQHRDATRIPLHEATRLLMNRCSGLLFARTRLSHTNFTAEDADFTGRNHAKAQLGFGDVVLTVFGQYHWSCRERLRRLQVLQSGTHLTWLEAVRTHHAQGVAFKLHPVRSTADRDDLEKQNSELAALGEQLWLWLEERRLGRPFASARDYAFSGGDKCPETRPGRNLLVNLKTFGPRAVAVPSPDRYPRGRLLESLPLLLWEPSTSPSPDIARRLRRNLNPETDSFAARVGAYQRLWQRFN